jgi:hypothetical protein
MREEGEFGPIIAVVVGESSLIREVLMRRMGISRGRQISTTD